jgi:hypothetical protein
LNFLENLGQRISKRSIANEKGLEYFLHNCVEDPVREIFDSLQGIHEVRREFQIGKGIVFENHPNAISDVADEVVQRQVPSTPDQGLSLGSIRPDQICVYRADDGLSKRTMLYITEYKAPHKLIAPHLRAGLHPMNIFKDVVNRKTIPPAAEPKARFQYHAERLTAAAITQTYDYMIEGGLEYGVLTTGEAIVFLKVDWEDPGTLFYHLAEPGPEVAAHPTEYRFCTAVCQYLVFSLMAIGSPNQPLQGHPQEERQRAKEGLERWAEDFETTLRSIPKDERSPPESSPFSPSIHLRGKRSPIFLRKNARRKSGQDGHPDNQPERNKSDDESSDDESPHRMPDSPSLSEPRPRGQAPSVRRSERILAQQPRGGGQQGQRYCTHKCLLGLVRSGRLDKNCPNMALHQQGTPRGPRHPISHTAFLRLLYEQLKKSLDDGVVQLGLQGSRGVLFQVTLLAYGYTFVSKATVTAFIPDLQHEKEVYQLLNQEQGVNVPVFLGTVDLREMGKTYYYDHRVYIKYMMFLSWGGQD